MTAPFLRAAAVAALVLLGLVLIAGGRELGVLRSRPLVLLVVVPVALLCLAGFRRSQP